MLPDSMGCWVPTPAAADGTLLDRAGLLLPTVLQTRRARQWWAAALPDCGCWVRQNTVLAAGLWQTPRRMEG